jgi:catechol 2,3-dioxygenase-like lactoylglutathione lyase family enzyme
MAVIGISHVAIGVRDMDRSLTFYRDILGLRQRYAAVEHLTSLNEVEAVSRTAVFLEYTDPQAHPASSFLVLDERPKHEQFGQPAEMFQLGIHHFSFWVDDIDAIVARGTAAGMPPFHGPKVGHAIGMGEQTGRQNTHASCLFKDPDGNVVQCDQRL